MQLLAQLQFEELTNRSKKNTQAPVKDKEEEGQSAAIGPLNVPPPPVVQPNPPAAPAGLQQPPLPVINVFTQQPNKMGWKRKTPQGGQRGRVRPNPGSPGVCWGCG